MIFRHEDLTSRRHLRSGSLADISERIRDVRFILKSRYPHGRHRCLLSARSRPRRSWGGLRRPVFVDPATDGHVIRDQRMIAHIALQIELSSCGAYVLQRNADRRGGASGPLIVKVDIDEVCAGRRNKARSARRALRSRRRCASVIWMVSDVRTADLAVRAGLCDLGAATLTGGGLLAAASCAALGSSIEARYL